MIEQHYPKKNQKKKERECNGRENAAGREQMQQKIRKTEARAHGTLAGEARWEN